MKAITKFFAITLLLGVLSCSKDDAPAPAPTPLPASGSFIRAKVDGVAFSSNIFGTETATANNIGSGSGRIIQLLGSNINANNVSIVLSGINSTGTYTINTSSDSVAAYTLSSGGAYGTGICSGATGTITVTSISDTKVEGTFSFTGKDGENCAATAKVVTEGSFRGVFVN